MGLDGECWSESSQATRPSDSISERIGYIFWDRRRLQDVDLGGMPSEVRGAAFIPQTRNSLSVEERLKDVSIPWNFVDDYLTEFLQSDCSGPPLSLEY